MPFLQFPADFDWGAATAAYQVEGAATADGRGESIWDHFAHTPGKVLNGDTGDVACDHYHRYAQDIALMQKLGLGAYRFSIAWPRILPDGTGAVNPAGLAFYDRLVDALLAANITPFATLYHWDLPQALHAHQCGWADRAIVDQFAQYADVVSRHLGDRVKHWATINEPKIVALLGYARGTHAPGIQDAALAARVRHHLLLAHGTAVPVLRQNAGADAQVGIVVALNPVFAPPEREAERAVADALQNRLFLDPIFKGRYPAVLLDQPETITPDVQPGDFDTISRPIDFVGVNYYSRTRIGAQDNVVLSPGEASDDGAEYTAMGWEVYPPGLYDVLRRVHADYAPRAIYITENGAAYDDVVSADGQVHDLRRVSYLRRHFAQAHRAIQDGVPLRGYFVWSLLDNFEWAYGYSRRFGIVYVDFDSLARVPKDSAMFYRSVIAANGVDV